MKKNVILASCVIFAIALSCCKSGPRAYAPPPVSPAKYKSVYVDVVYDPVLLVTHDDTEAIVKDLHSRLAAMGFVPSISSDHADMTLRITIDELDLTGREGRLLAGATFGLTKKKARMIYTASFVDNKTLDEITSVKHEFDSKKYFPSKEELKAKFIAEMKDQIVKFMSESKDF